MCPLFGGFTTSSNVMLSIHYLSPPSKLSNNRVWVIDFRGVHLCWFIWEKAGQGRLLLCLNRGVQPLNKCIVGSYDACCHSVQTVITLFFICCIWGWSKDFVLRWAINTVRYVLPERKCRSGISSVIVSTLFSCRNAAHAFAPMVPPISFTYWLYPSVQV